MRSVLALLLAAVLAGPAAAPAPLAVRVSEAQAGRVVSWPTVAGQDSACAYRLDGQLIECLTGTATSLTIWRGGDAELRTGVAPLAVEVYGRGAVLATGRSWAVYLPTLASARAPTVWRLYLPRVAR